MVGSSETSAFWRTKSRQPGEPGKRALPETARKEEEILRGSQIFLSWRKTMKTRKKIFDYEYEEVLDTRVRELIRVGCAVAVGCPD
jgi:alkylhydroperoxidase/carboxymuconolactone decarboxylase family protein YurZ